MNWTRFFRLLQPIMVVAALLFMALLLAWQWRDLREYQWTLRPGWLLLSALLLLASWAMEIGIWRHLLRLVGATLPFAPAVRIWFISAVVRYIPGNIWQPLSMSLQCLRWHVPVEATLTSVALYQAVILLAVAPWTAVYLAVTGNLGLLARYLAGATPWLIGVAALPALLFLIRPRMVDPCRQLGVGQTGATTASFAFDERAVVASVGRGCGQLAALGRIICRARLWPR